MGKKCSLCGRFIRGNRSGYSVPKDPRRRELWNASCRTTFAGVASICHDHFVQAHIIQASSRTFLMPSAVPLIQAGYKHNEDGM